MVSISSLAPAASITLRVRPKTHPAAQDADATVLGADELSQHANKRELRLMDKSQFEFSASSKG
jgi:hypothetical protein